MSYWSDYYDDFSQDILLYKEKLPVTPVQFMRWAAEGLRKAQHLVKYVLGIKIITTADGTNFPLGDDVMILINVIDITNGPSSVGAEVIRQGMIQKRDTIERSLIGTNEVPHFVAQFRYGTLLNPPLRRFRGTYENVVYDRLNNTIRLYPAVPINTELLIEYVVDFKPFSPVYTQWSGWFPVDSNSFLTQFTSVPLPVEWTIYDTAFKAYAVMKYLLSNRNGDYRVYGQMFEGEINIIRETISRDYYLGASPYVVSPDSY